MLLKWSRVIIFSAIFAFLAAAALCQILRINQNSEPADAVLVFSLDGGNQWQEK